MQSQLDYKIHIFTQSGENLRYFLSYSGEICTFSRHLTTGDIYNQLEFLLKSIFCARLRFVCCLFLV